MSKYRICLFFFAAFSAIAMSGLNCTPGELKSLVSNPESITSLSLTGEIDATDLQFIASSMPVLKSLDLTETQIRKTRDSKTIYPEATIPSMVFAGAPFTSLSLPLQEGLMIDDAAFTGSKISSLTIPSTVKHIGVGAFAACPNLQTVILNANTEFASDVFSGCDALAVVDMGGAKEISASMFANCKSLRDISCREGLRTIGNNAFTGDINLTSFPFPSTLQSIGDDAFAHSGIKEALLDQCQSLKNIGARAFAQAPELQKVSLPNSVATLGTGVFALDPALSEVKLSTAIAHIPDYAFTSSANVPADDILHDGVEQIGAYALKGHDSTSSLFLPAYVSYIGDHAMEGMTGLNEIDVTTHTEVPALGKDVWAGIEQKNVNLKVGEDMASPFRNAAQWQDFSIKEPTVNIDEVAAPSQSVQARFIGSLLEIVSTGSAITSVEIFTPAGKQLALLRAGDNRVEIDTQSWQENIYIVSVTLSDGSRATAKLLRII